MVLVKAKIGRKKYEIKIASSTNTIIADEPLDLGGEDLGFSPSELLASSLSACTCATLRMYADRKQWDLESIEVETTFERDNFKNESLIKRNIRLTGNLDEEQKKRLVAIANSCFIHKTLSNPIHISTEIIV